VLPLVEIQGRVTLNVPIPDYRLKPTASKVMSKDNPSAAGCMADCVKFGQL